MNTILEALRALKEEDQSDIQVPEQIFKELKANYLDESWETRVETTTHNGFVFAELKVIEKDIEITDADFWDEEGYFKIGSLGTDFSKEVGRALHDFIKDKNFKESEQDKFALWYHIPETSWWICSSVDEGEIVEEEPTASFSYTPATYWSPAELDANYSDEYVDIYTTIYLRKKAEN